MWEILGIRRAPLGALFSNGRLRGNSLMPGDATRRNSHVKTAGTLDNPPITRHAIHWKADGIVDGLHDDRAAIRHLGAHIQRLRELCLADHGAYREEGVSAAITAVAPRAMTGGNWQVATNRSRVA
jgi:hypothetical protein